MICLNQIYYIYTQFSHLIYGFSVAYIAKGDPVQKMMLMKFINQMESRIELYWTKKCSMSQFWIQWWWWRWEKVIESNSGDILFTHPFPWVSLFLFWLSLIRIRRRLKKKKWRTWLCSMEKKMNETQRQTITDDWPSVKSMNLEPPFTDYWPQTINKSHKPINKTTASSSIHKPRTL